MANNSVDGIGFVIGGTVAGTGLSATVGGIGLVGGFGGFGVGIGAMAAIGGLGGAAAYGAFKAREEGDATAFGAIGLGALGGASVAQVVGSIGLSVKGGAFAIGIGSMAVAGGLTALGIYGVAKILLDSDTKEPIAQTFERMEEKIAYQEAYNQALIDLYISSLSKGNLDAKWSKLELEEELRKLKETFYLQNKTNPEQDQPQPESDRENGGLVVSLNQVWKCVQVFQEHTASVNSVAISPDGQILASGSDDQTVRLWSLETGKLLYTFFGQGEKVRGVTISSNGEILIAGGYDNRITAWHLKTKALFCSFFGRNSYYSHAGAITSVLFSPDQKFIISASGDRTIRLWGSYTGELKRTLNGHSDTVWSIALSPDGQTLASGSADKTIRLWNLSNYQPPRLLNGHSGTITSVAISPDGNTLISGSTDSTIKLWNLSTGELIRTLTEHKTGVFALAISPDEKIFASASTTEIKLWNLSTGKLLHNLSGCSPVAFNPDGQTLVSGGSQGSIKIWTQMLGSEALEDELIMAREWWEVLGVTKDVHPNEVRQAYRRLARQYHPDLNRTVNAVTKMQEINQAYDQFLKELNQALL